jgi:enoyl-CoA hydratase/carnithine racemase
VIDLEREGSDVWILRMREGENAFTPAFLDAFGAALDRVEASAGPAGLVTTGDGKFYSNGLDLGSLAGSTREEIGAHLRRVHALFARVLAFPRITVAALNGHAFAGGAMLALAHDFRLLRADRGWICLPEIDLRLALQPAMTALIRDRLPRRTAHEALVTGRRFDAAAALAAGLTDEAADAEALLPRAIALARAYAGKHPPTVAALKRGLYAETLRLLESPAGVAL